VGAVDALWEQRLLPYAANLAGGTRSRRPDRVSDCVVDPRPDWEARAERVVARIAAALAPTDVATEVSHVGSTSVPGLLAKDVIDVQVGLHDLADIDREDVREAFVGAGYVVSHGIHSDTPHPKGADASAWLKQFLGGCDPGNHVHVHVREHGSAGWRFALLFRDWLRHVPDERDAYAAEKRRLLEVHDTTSAYVEAKEPWFEGAWHRANAWAERTGWRP
jgi:dephospho-CoA kinase